MYFFPAVFTLAVFSICNGQHDNTCNVVPKDQYIEMGSNTDIVCQTSCVHGKIFWTLNNRRLDESLSDTINSSHTVLSLRNFTHQSATLQCHSADTHQVLGGTTIRTYSKPNKIACILHNKNQTEGLFPDLFTCKWEHQINPSLEVNYSVLRASSLKPSQSEICKSQSHETNCTAENIYDQIYMVENITITVRAKTAYWKVDSDPSEFHPYHMLKLIRPKVTVTAFSDHLLVKWEPKSYSRECHCQVNYSKAVYERAPELVLNKTLKELHKTGQVTIKEVESCSNYTFSVRCALDKAPWSDWSEEKTVMTRLNKNDVKLQLWRKVAEPEENGVRKVHAMWKEIPSTCQDTFTYTLKQTPYKEHTSGINDMDTLCGRSTCDVDVNQDAHRINLTVHNEALLVDDSVYVPAIGESLPRVTDIQTSALEGVIVVSWKSVQPVRCYMIDWTHDGNQYYWKESKYMNATLSDLLDKKPYNITVTPLFDDKTGHGAQALQICSRVGDPGNVTIQVQANDKSAVVSWNVKSQEVCSGVIVNYTVFYSMQEGPQLNVTVDGTEQFISLKDLNPDTQYSVYVMATALSGTTKSSETLFKTKRFGRGLIPAVSVCGSIIILLVLTLGLFCAARWKKFREKLVPNPGLSSVALWPAPRSQEGICPFQPFNDPSESHCDRVYTMETQRTPTSLLATDCNGNSASDQTEEYVDPSTVLAPDVQTNNNKDPVEPPETSSPDDFTALLPSENGQLSPYRSQTCVESPAPRSGKHSKRIPVKQPEKTTPMTVYVTLDMFEQGQGR